MDLDMFDYDVQEFRNLCKADATWKLELDS
jgi:hypothetical protein